MSLTPETTADSVSDRDTDWQTGQQGFAAKRAAFWWDKQVLQEQRHSLREETNSLEQERGLFEQERLALWKDLQAKWQLNESHQHQLHDLQERRKHSAAFLDALRQERDTFQASQKAFQDQLRLLHEQRMALRDIPDLAQRQQAFQQLQAEYLHLQQALREQEQILREQRATYHQLQLDYGAQRMLLYAEKSVRQQRQEERRWREYGNYSNSRMYYTIYQRGG